MKTKLLLSCLLFFVASNAQFTVGQDSIYEVFDTDESDVAIYNTQNTANPVITMKWEIVSISAPSTWEQDFFICDAIQCWDSTYNSNEYDLVDNKDKPLDCHFLNNGNIGVGIAKIRIWQVGDSVNTAKIVTYTAEVEQATGIRNNTSLDLSIHPNPASNFITINNIDFAEIANIEIFNIIGKKVLSFNNDITSEVINISDLDNGIYIIRITDQNFNTYTQNFSKK